MELEKPLELLDVPVGGGEEVLGLSDSGGGGRDAGRLQLGLLLLLGDPGG
jgi:hypothetical protein